MKKEVDINRRNLLRMGLVTAGGLLATSAAAAQAVCHLRSTPVQPEGPFYPIQDQPDKDTDLIYVNGSSKQAQGTVIIVEGIVTNQLCEPVAGALVEIWQACHTGKYNHPSDPNTAALDPNFQYWGKAISKADGHYQFRTILPGAYPAGDALNDQDLILNRLPLSERNSVVVPLIEKDSVDYPVAQFNITLEKI